MDLFEYADQKSPSRKNVFTEILEFSKGLSLWQNEAIRVLFKKRVLEPGDLDELLGVAKKEYSIEPSDLDKAGLMLKASELPLPPTSKTIVHLKSLKQVDNVCALHSGQTLNFSERLTVIYGENASGKSSYARVLKRAFRSRDDEKIHPNVFEQISSKPASAVFEFRENGASVPPVTWLDGTAGEEVFGRFAVLDAKCQRVYITKDCELDFLPYGFEIFQSLVRVTDSVKSSLTGMAEQLKPSPDVLKPYSTETQCGRFIGGITAATTKEQVLENIKFSQTDEDLLFKLRKEKAELDSPELAKKLLEEEKKRLSAAKATVEDLYEKLSDAVVANIKKALSDLKTRLEAVKVTSKILDGDQAIEGVGTPAWVTLLNSAASYSQTLVYPEKTYPAEIENELCVLCQQPLSITAKERLKKYWSYLNDTSSKQLEETNLELEQFANTVNALPNEIPQEVQAWVGSFPQCEINAYAEIQAFYKALIARKQVVTKNLVSKSWGVEVGPLESLALKLKAAIETLNKKITAFDNTSALADRLLVVAKQMKELEVRKKCNEDQVTLLDYLEKLHRSALVAGVSKKITTRKITEKYESLFSELVTAEFKGKIRNELKLLGFGDIRTGIGDRLEKARVVFKVTVEAGAQVKPEEIFSEGERTAISIACFLAELELNGDKCGIILDDPISSLDHKVRKKVVERLVAEAAKRQVVVFTHDLVFLSELKEVAEKQAVELHEQMVESLEGTFGIIDVDGSWDSMAVKTRIELLERKLIDAKKALEDNDAVKYKALVGNVVDRLRSTWERAVEELLFCKVIERYVREVKTLSLTGVVTDDESVKLVFEGMTRVSNLTPAHDAAMGENRPKVSLDIAKQELEALKSFCALQRGKIKKVREARDHWK